MTPELTVTINAVMWHECKEISNKYNWHTRSGLRVKGHVAHGINKYNMLVVARNIDIQKQNHGHCVPSRRASTVKLALFVSTGVSAVERREK